VSQFLGLSLVGPVALGYLVVVAVLVQIGTALGDLTNITWVASGYAVSQSVSFSIAGNLSDFFGRRYLILAGNLISLIGAVSSFHLPSGYFFS
jgi:MFS family permease